MQTRQEYPTRNRESETLPLLAVEVEDAAGSVYQFTPFSLVAKVLHYPGFS